MIAKHRRGALHLAIAALALLGMRGEAHGQDAERAEEPLPLPTVAQGWRIGMSLFGGWDSNPLDLPGGPSDRDYGVGGDIAWGNLGRRGAFGVSAQGSRLEYEELKERNAWRGAAALTMGRRLSRNSVLSLSGGARYDYTDEFLALPGISAQLPRTVALGGYGEGRLDLKLARRTSWLNAVRYESVDFEGEELSDTRSFRVRSAFSRQVARRDHVWASYEFLRARWGGQDDDSHAGFLGWKHGFSEEWSIEIEPGVSRVVATDPADSSVKWLFAGGAALNGKADRASLSLSYRRSATPGYGLGQLLYSDIVQASVTLPFGGRLELRMAAAADRSTDPFDPAYRAEGAYTDAGLAVRILGPLGIAASYRYRFREYSGEPRVEGHRVGLALTTVFESRRRETRGEGRGR